MITNKKFKAYHPELGVRNFTSAVWSRLPPDKGGWSTSKPSASDSEGADADAGDGVPDEIKPLAEKAKKGA